MTKQLPEFDADELASLIVSLEPHVQFDAGIVMTGTVDESANAETWTVGVKSSAKLRSLRSFLRNPVDKSARANYSNESKVWRRPRLPRAVPKRAPPHMPLAMQGLG